MRAIAQHRSHAGQAVLELAIAMPFVLTLLAGSGQIGAIVYGQVTVDTAAREGARDAAQDPTDALDFAAGSSGTTSYVCGQSPTDAKTEQSVCIDARNASGLLNGSNMSVTVVANVPVARVPTDVVQVASNCTGSRATVTGTVSGIPAGAALPTVTATATNDTTTTATPSSGSATYLLCVSIPSGNSVTTNLQAAISSIPGCSKTVGPFTFAKNGSYTGIEIALPDAQCAPAATTSTTSSTATSTTTTSTVTSTASSFPVPPPNPSPACSSQWDGTYVTVTVSYQVPIFVPVVGNLLATSGQSYRVVSASETIPADPCSVAQQ